LLKKFNALNFCERNKLKKLIIRKTILGGGRGSEALVGGAS